MTSTLTHREVSKMDIRQVVADPKWQALRKSFLGTWKTRTIQNCWDLWGYLMEDRQDPMRWRRVHNYLTGTAFRCGYITHPAISSLLAMVRKERGLA